MTEPLAARPLNVWDERYASEGFLFGTAPNGYLVERRAHLRPGPTLCVADGEGRNSVWLAGQGFKVDAFDASAVAVGKAQALALARAVTVRHQLSDWRAFDWGVARYDNVVAIFIQFLGGAERLELLERIDQCLHPGGALVIQGYTPRQLQYRTGGPDRVENLYETGLLESAFSGYRIVDAREYEAHLDEGPGHQGRSALVGFTAFKP